MLGALAVVMVVLVCDGDFIVFVVLAFVVVLFCSVFQVDVFEN